MTHKKTTISALVTASLVAAAMFSTPAAAIPNNNNGNGGEPAESTFSTLFGPGCYVTDGNGVDYLDLQCQYHNTLKLQNAGADDPAVGMYWDHGNLSDVAGQNPVYPTSEMTTDWGFWYLDKYWIRCQSRTMPSGEYKSSCYFNNQTQKNFAPQ